MPLKDIHGRHPDEPGHEAVGGAVIQADRIGHLLDQPVLHHHDPLPHGHRFDLIMGHVDHRRAQLTVQPADLHAHLDAHFGIQVREGFVKEEHRRLAHDGAAHRHALPLPTGQRLGAPFQEFVNTEDAGRFLYAGLNFLLGKLAQFQSKRHVFAHCHMRIQGIVPNHHGDIPVLGRNVIDHAVADLDDPARNLLQSRYHAQRGGLSTARRPHQHHELAILDLQVEIIHGLDVAGINLVHMLQDDSCHSAA